MSYLLGDTVYETFTIHDESGALTNADSLPTAVLVRKNVNTDQEITVTNISTGKYNIETVIPDNWAVGDVVHIIVDATVGGVAGALVLRLGKINNKITMYKNEKNLVKIA